MTPAQFSQLTAQLSQEARTTDLLLIDILIVMAALMIITVLTRSRR